MVIYISLFYRSILAKGFKQGFEQGFEQGFDKGFLTKF